MHDAQASAPSQGLHRIDPAFDSRDITQQAMRACPELASAAEVAACAGGAGHPCSRDAQLSAGVRNASREPTRQAAGSAVEVAQLGHGAGGVPPGGQGAPQAPVARQPQQLQVGEGALGCPLCTCRASVRSWACTQPLGQACMQGADTDNCCICMQFCRVDDVHKHIVTAKHVLTSLLLGHMTAVELQTSHTASHAPSMRDTDHQVCPQSDHSIPDRAAAGSASGIQAQVASYPPEGCVTG